MPARTWSLLSVLMLLSGSAFAADVSLVERDWDGVQTWVRAQRKVVVVDVWTSTCPKCVEELPKFVALAKKSKKENPGVTWLTVNCDYDGIADKPPAFYRPDVQKLLGEHGATTENVLLTVPFVDFLDKVKLSSTPAVLVYSADGKLLRRFDNDHADSEADEFTLHDVAKFVKSLSGQSRARSEALRAE